jgi:hypothetical protein
VEGVSARYEIPGCYNNFPSHADPFQRRKKQNRDSQRAFRARERTRVEGLEERLADLTQQHRELKFAYLHLNIKYQSLVENVEIKEEVVDANVSLWQESYNPLE